MSFTRNFGVASALSMALVVASTQAGAQSITINNPSFEQNPISGWVLGIPGWQVSPDYAPGFLGDVGYYRAPPTVGLHPIPDGVHVAFSNDGELWQTTSEAVTPGFRYTLKAYVGGRSDPFQSAPLYGRNYALILETPFGELASTEGKNELGWIQATTVYDSPLGDPAAGQYITVRLTGDGAQVNFDMVTLEKTALLQCGGFAPPFGAPISIKKNTNRAIPLKIKILDVFGNQLTDQDIAPPVVQVAKDTSSGSDITGYDGDLLPAGLGDDGNEFRYDWNEMRWVLNLATRPYTAAGDYIVKVLAADESYALDNGCTQTFTRLP